MNDYPPIVRPPPATLERAFRGILESLFKNLRARPMGAARTISGPGGDPIEEELELSHACDPDTVEPLSKALDRAIRGDSALWAGYDGLTRAADGSVVLSWPRWISLRLFAKE